MADRLAVPVAEACQILGGIPSFTIGTRRLVSVDGLRAWVAARTTEAA